MSQQLAIRFKNPGRAKLGHGGRRKGAGRPNRSGKQGHTRRPALSPRHPVHVTLRLRDGLPSLRRKDVFKVLRESVAVARLAGFGVVHFAILSNHLHFLIEPRARRAFFRAMQSFEISFTRRFNGLAGREGSAFADRYDLRVLDNPTRVRNALVYVLSNESKHRRDRVPSLFVSPFSSALLFDEGQRLLGRHRLFLDPRWPLEEVRAWVSEIARPAETWLLRVGWRRAPGATS